MTIKCCKDCVPPTRYPGCHAKCDKYLKEKAEWEVTKQIIAKNKAPVINSKRRKRRSR